MEGAAALLGLDTPFILGFGAAGAAFGWAWHYLDQYEEASAADAFERADRAYYGEDEQVPRKRATRADIDG